MTEKSLEKDLNFYPVLPLKNVVAMPKNIIPVIVGREISIKAVEYALKDKKEVFVTAQKSSTTEKPTLKDVFEWGIKAVILQATRLPNGTLKILIEGVCRAKVAHSQEAEGFMAVSIDEFPPVLPEKNPENEALWRTLRDAFKHFIQLNEKVPNELSEMFDNLSELDYLCDTVTSHIQLKLKERQKLLETTDLRKRAEKLIKLLNNEIEVIKTEKKIKKRVQDQVEKHQKDYYLQEQMRAIQSELGRDGQQNEIAELRKKAKAAKMSAEAFEKVEYELKRLEQMQPSSPEAVVSRSYIDWLISLPWYKESKDTVSLAKSEKALRNSHAAMGKAKERILEFIATKKFAKDKLKRSPIVCLAGPPGVGKTSLAKSIAESLGREFVRISLGGMRDEAEIRGHRKTYIGAMPGKIVQAMKKAGTTNPVMLLDEIDKMSSDFRGDPASAMLEILDPETNGTFADYFLEVDYDLSKVMFITTANVVDNIPYALLDRMEIINLPGYTAKEKVEIASKFLLPRLLEEHALTKSQFKISDELLDVIVEEYTKEAGVRQLERVIAKVIRRAIQELLSDKKKKSVTVDLDRLRKWLGSAKFKKQDKKHEEAIGLTTGLAWTEVGGDILDVEVSILKGKGSLSLTGQIGEVMQESGQAALTYIRSRAKEFGLKEDFYADLDIHMHIPEGAIPKDGPSAGITMTTALVSALTKKPVHKALAMTGEVTLRGRVLAVGGLKEKLLAAVRFGIKKVIVPKENEDEIKEFAADLGLDQALEIVYADNMDEVLKHAMVESPFKSTKKVAAKRKTAKKKKATK